ncbi:hypothetical protein BST81_23880 [Leptolyngbya sp. 'hensonii']|uniref:PAS domain S-box protein n=1 Tax=Leptolyngbya sp. 'hensonii' TaxID=1922337 RepID=UPI00094F9497|nr:PAS domain S-box protein [Leptolyngbya sp. 'hensonii']OLP15868.1 hypothetical protein BST81_23880 [Leptolyngbya sp. 'hensonii']
MSDRNALTLLLIEDCADARILYRRFLRWDSLYTYQIVEFETAIAAAAWCQQEVPDLILLDLLLPDQNGLEFLQELRKYRNSTQSAVIILTAQSDPDTVIDAMKSGAQDYLVKDKLTPELLQQTIHRAIERMQLARQVEYSQEQQRLIGAIALRIRQSLHLDEILHTTAIEVRQFLQTDRVLVYQFHADMSGSVVAESVLPGWAVALGSHIEDTYFQERGGATAYQQGRKQIVDDIYQADLTNCHINLLEQFEVKAILVVPILVKAQLWGLLVAQHCAAARHWRPEEPDFLEQLAVQIAIAIQQASAFEQAQVELAERQRTEAVLRESEERFRSTFEQAAVGITHVAPNGQFIRFNRRFCDIVGYTAAELQGLTFQEITHPDDLVNDLKQSQKLLAGKIQTYAIEKRYIRKDRSIVWINLTGSLVRNPWGAPEYFIGVIEDITTRKRAEAALYRLNQELEARVEQRTAALQESEERWQLALRGSNDGIWDWDVQNNQVFFSSRWKEMRGFSADGMTHSLEEWPNQIHPDDRDRVMQAIANHFARKTPFFREEYRVKRQDGSYMWILDRAQALWDSAGNPTRMVGSETDITERKLAEERLRNLSDRLALALRSGAIGTWEWDIVNNVRIWDDRMHELYGVPPFEPERTCEFWLNSIYPEDVPGVETALEQAVQGEKDFDLEFRVVHPNGSIHFLKAAGLVQRDEQGNPLRMIGINYDITHQKQAEAALRESERRYATLAEASPVAIFQLDAAGHCTYVNNRWSEMMGRPPESALGTGCFQTLHPEDQAQILQDWANKFEHGIGLGEGYQIECRHVHTDGRIIWTYNQVLPETDAEGIQVGYIGTLTDITDRKQVEAQLRQTNEHLAYATRLKDEFLATMSHELRTPLNAILGMSEGLQDGVFGSINDRQMRAIATIERSGKHLLELINDILDLSKIESGKLEVEMGEVFIRNLCDTSMTFVRQMAIQKKIQLSSQIPQDIGQIQADDRRLRQVLINLLNNAIKFTPEGGSVTLEVSRQASYQMESLANMPTSNSWVLFSVTDTGIGIAAEDLNKLFQPFMQIDSSLNRQYSGTGLGLSLVRRIAELHGGAVTVRSELGQGSCFTVRIPDRTCPLNEANLPVHVPAIATPSQSLPGAVPSPSGRSPLILLAEDNEANVETISSYLEGRNYRFILAIDGQQAIDLTRTQHPDLVLMDIQIPGVDGLEAIRQIRSDPTVADIPVIALTALAMVGDREKCLEAGATEYLAKPLALKQLEILMHQLLNR